jgi:hypothetical protein
MADPDDDLELPPALRTAIRERMPTAPRVPAAVDRAVLLAARVRLARRHWWQFIGAAAAVVAVGVTVAILHVPAQLPPVATIAGDVNGDAAVDVLDALALARRPDTSADVDALLDRLVRVEAAP